MSYIIIKSDKLILMCNIFIENRSVNKSDKLRSVVRAETLREMALISDTIQLSMDDFCYLAEEVDVIEGF